MELEIEEDFLALADQLARELEAARVTELVADLVEDDVLAESGNDGPRLLDVRYVKADDQSISRIHPHIPSILP